MVKFASNEWRVFMEEVVLVDLLQDGDAATREYCAEAGRCDTLHRYRIVPVVPFA